MIKVSIIIPIYNTEQYLSICLDSVCNQTLSDIEIICINDCSMDNSLKILNSYAQQDNRIKIIDLKENKGAGYARNRGIELAKGEYIGFVDSDDFIDLDFYEKLYKKGIETNGDIIKGCSKNIYPDGNVIIDFNLNNKIQSYKVPFHSWFTTAIYKKVMIDDKKIRFPENYFYNEDKYFSIVCGYYANQIIICNEVLYSRMLRKNSTSVINLNQDRLKVLCTFLNSIYDFCKTANDNFKNYIILKYFIIFIKELIKKEEYGTNNLKYILSKFEKKILFVRLRKNIAT